MTLSNEEWLTRKNAELDRLRRADSISKTTNCWKTNHILAWCFPTYIENPIVSAIRAWQDMLDSHGLDYINRDGWAAMGETLRTYLNYDWGTRLDMGTLDKIICDELTKEGYDTDMSEWKE